METSAEALTFEKVWLMFQESDRQFREFRERTEEADRKYREQKEQSDQEYRKQKEQSDQEYRKQKEQSDREYWEQKEKSDREYRERMEEADRKDRERMKEIDRRIGELSNRFGELAEHLVLPSIKEKFNARGFEFDKCSKYVDIADAQDRFTGAEIDILLENGEVAIAVEVKARALEKHIDRHIERIEVLRRWADRHGDRRKFQGAIAGAIMTDEVRKYALKAGLYVIIQTGDTVEISVPEGFTPREW